MKYLFLLISCVIMSCAPRIIIDADEPVYITVVEKDGIVVIDTLTVGEMLNIKE